MSQPREEREVFTALIQTHGHAMYRAARALLPSDTAAEDAVGEAVLLAWQACPQLKRREAARAWLLKITVNCAYGQFRRERPTLPLEEAAVQTAPTPEPLGLWELVQTLPPDQRLAVTLYYYDGLSVAEIAQVAGAPPGTIKSRLSRGRDRLRELLREEGVYGL